MRWLAAALLLGLSCTVGPRYHRPRVALPASGTYKETTLKLATPGDAIPRGHWWTLFHDRELDALEARVQIDNQTVAQAIANFRAASAQIRQARAAYYPTVSVVPSATLSRGGSAIVRGTSTGTGGTSGTTTGSPTTTGTTTTTATAATSSGGGRTPFYTLPIDFSWAPDLFGRVRNTVRQRLYAAQAAAADVENAKLVAQATLAQTYFQLRGQDALVELLAATVAADTQILAVTRSRYQLGLANEAEVLQAEQTLEAARVQQTNAGILRAQYEHAIATLIGVPASAFSLPKRGLAARPPTVPPGTPSQLLERRPDIAAAERQMASANAAIGVGYAAYFPVLTLSGDAGFSSTSLDTLLSWPQRVWSVGANLVQTIFDGGLRGATIDQARAAYDAAVAGYRQTVLTAFQQVEDQLATLRILAVSIEQQRHAVALAQRALEVERARYETGLDPYLNLMTQQTILLSAQQTLVSLEVEQMSATVLLIQALGGGWDANAVGGTAALTPRSGLRPQASGLGKK